MKIKSLVMSMALVAATAGSAAAQTSLFSSFVISTSHPVEYTPFYVTQAGTFNFDTYSSTDPSIYIFTGAQSSAPLTGSFVAYNDDYWTLQSHITINLSAGAYTVATSRFYFDLNEAVNGYNDYANAGPITLGITSEHGDANFSNVTPEPVTMTLLGTGLLGIAAKRRRRKAAEAVA